MVSEQGTSGQQVRRRKSTGEENKAAATLWRGKPWTLVQESVVWDSKGRFNDYSAQKLQREQRTDVDSRFWVFVEWDRVNSRAQLNRMPQCMQNSEIHHSDLVALHTIASSDCSETWRAKSTSHRQHIGVWIAGGSQVEGGADRHR